MTIRVNAGVTIGPVGTKLKKIIDHYPGNHSGLYVTSAYRAGDGGHHGGLTRNGSPTAALDIGFGHGTAGYEQRAREFAGWLYQFSDQIVELIVSKVGTGLANGGYYVKNGARVAPYAHTGADASARHENHVHFASSSALADAILEVLEKVPETQPPQPQPEPEPKPLPLPPPETGPVTLEAINAKLDRVLSLLEGRCCAFLPPDKR